MNFAINCKKENEAKILMNFLDSKGFKWQSGKKLTSYALWDECGKNTCYLLCYYSHDKVVTYTSIDNCLKNRCVEIISSEDFMNDYQKYTNGFFGE